MGAVRCCYEAGPCGFELQRALTAAGVPCEVHRPGVDPASIGRPASRPTAGMPVSSRSSIGSARCRTQARSSAPGHLQSWTGASLAPLGCREDEKSLVDDDFVLKSSRSSAAWGARSSGSIAGISGSPRRKPKQHVVTAIARELTGFVWASLTQCADRPTSKGEPS